jgi:hypothetical protein
MFLTGPHATAVCTLITNSDGPVFRWLTCVYVTEDDDQAIGFSLGLPLVLSAQRVKVLVRNYLIGD